MDHFQYLILMGLCLAITLPLEWAFGARVWRRPRRLLAAVGPAFVLFYLWDAAAIARGHWTFDAQYVTGVVLPLGVPLEEAVFFVVIPVCALLAYESVDNLLAGRVGWARRILDRTGARSAEASSSGVGD